MKIAVVGTRGIPGVHGGVERHCEELYPRIAAAGHEVCVYARQGYVEQSQCYRGVDIVTLAAPRGPGIEALLHTVVAIMRAARDGCDVLHVHSVGPSVLIPLARSLRLRRIVSTLHAPDYRQQKWGSGARRLLRSGERTAVRTASASIAVSQWYARDLSSRYGREVRFIPNGPGLVGIHPSRDRGILRELAVHAGEYLLFVGRLIPDKRLEDAVEAARRVGRPLVVAGDSNDSPGYVDDVRARSGVHVRFAGYVHGSDLMDLYLGSYCLVLPSAVEGLPIAVLEAMSLRVPAVLSDIAAHREVSDGGRCGVLYPCGDVNALESAIRSLAEPHVRDRVTEAACERIREMYDWDRIAAETLDVYEAVCAQD